MNTGQLHFGDLFEELFDFKCVTWKIPNFLSLPLSVDQLQSETFPFAGATWRLQIYPNEKTPQDSESFISMSIIRLNSQISEHRISYELYFKTRKRRKFNPFASTQTYNAGCCDWGVFNYAKRSEFLQMKKALAPKGVLTVVCEMRIKKTVKIAKYSEMNLATPLLGPDDTLQSNFPDLPDSKVLHDFKDLFLKKDGCDVLLKVEEVEFPAHRAILSARSPVFSSIFQNGVNENETDVIHIKDCDPSTFSDFLCFLYCGDIQKFWLKNVCSLFTTADKYNVPDLRAKCLAFMEENLSIDTFCDTFTLAHEHSEKELIKLTTDFFIMNIREIIVTVKWQSFASKNPMQSNELIIKALVPDFNKNL